MLAENLSCLWSSPDPSPVPAAPAMLRGLLPAVEFLYKRGKQGSERKELSESHCWSKARSALNPSLFYHWDRRGPEKSTMASQDGPHCTASQIPRGPRVPLHPSDQGSLVDAHPGGPSRKLQVLRSVPEASPGQGQDWQC